MRPISLTSVIPLLLSGGALAQTAASADESGTSNDLFVMSGSDLVRPGLLPKANYNIGMGHTFAFLGKNPFGDGHSIWIQDSYNKIVTIPWYTTASIGYTRSW